MEGNDSGTVVQLAIGDLALAAVRDASARSVCNTTVRRSTLEDLAFEALLVSGRGGTEK